MRMASPRPSGISRYRPAKSPTRQAIGRKGGSDAAFADDDGKHAPREVFGHQEKVRPDPDRSAHDHPAAELLVRLDEHAVIGTLRSHHALAVDHRRNGAAVG